MQKITLLTIFLLGIAGIDAQNLIANGGLEESNICFEYLKTCAPEAWFHMPPEKPISLRDLPDPYKGQHYEVVVMENFVQPVTKRIFLYTRLRCPLEAGEQYQLVFYMNPAMVKTFQFGAVFTSMQPNLKDAAPMTMGPGIAFSSKSHQTKEKGKWRKMEATYTAKGGEEYLIFGNFDPNPMLLPPKEKTRLEIKFLFDEIELMPISPNHVPCPDLAERTQAIFQTDERHTIPGIAVYTPAQDTMPYMPDTTADAETAETQVQATFEPDPEPSLKFVIPDIGFDFGAFELKPSVNTLLEVCAEQIVQQKPQKVHIAGFTDNVGSETFNLDLSAKRALAVKSWFVENYGLSADQFETEGMGEANPIAPNDSEAGRQANRRVEINFVK